MTTARACLTCGTPMVPRTREVTPPPPGHVFHQARGHCASCYMRHLRENKEFNEAVRIPRTCTALTGTCTCWACALAEADHESPAALTGGAWVPSRHGIRTWQATA